MKRATIFILGLCCAIGTHAQLVQDNEQALVYYMPETQLVFDVEYTEETLEAGPFFLFAEKYLGAQSVIEENRTLYHLTAVHAATHTTTDYTRAYKVLPERGVQAGLLTLTKKGLLEGYNNVPSTSLTPPKEGIPNRLQSPSLRGERETVLPLFEEQIVAPTLQQKAAGAAKQIYRIRETRLYILSGETEHVPADGKALELTLRELDRMEQELVELFVGKRTIRSHHKKITFVPSKSEETALLYFSEEKGLTTEEDAAAAPLLLTIAAHKQILSAGTTPDKKVSQPSQLYYNLPGWADYAVTYQGEILAEKTLPIAQFGIGVPLSRDLFTGNTLPHIVFDTQTGAIRSITH